MKLDEPEVRSKPRCRAMADLGPSTEEEIPNARAATTTAMAPVAITDLDLLNRSDFIYFLVCAVMGKTTEGLRVRPAIRR